MTSVLVLSRSSARAHQQQQQQQQQQLTPVVIAVPEVATASLADATGGALEDASSAAGWQVDPNEPRYCICNDVSYGEMVGCDNEDVSSESSRLL